MSQEERTKFFRYSKNKMIIVKIFRSPRDEFSDSKIRHRSSARIAKSRLASERDMFNISTVVTLIRGKT
jgi:hypothetical protein